MRDYQNATKKVDYKNYGLHVAEVVNNKDDKKKRGRIQVRIMGITDDKLPKKECPWAENGNSILAGSKTKAGVSSVPANKSFVYVMFLHGDPSHPIYLGTIIGEKKKKSNISKIHNKSDKSDFEKARSAKKIGCEPGTSCSDSEYPDCNVIETRTGNVIILDDSKGATRVIIGHGESASYFEIRHDGSVVVKTNKDQYDIIKKDRHVYIEGEHTSKIKKDSDELIEGNNKVNIKKDSLEEIEGNLKENVKKDYEINVDGNLKINVKGSVEINGKSIDLNGSTPLLVKSNEKSITRMGDKDDHDATNLPPI